MKKISLHLLSLLVLLLGMAACQKEMAPTEYTHAIPSDATEVAAISLEQLATKAGLGQESNAVLRGKLLAMLTEESCGSLQEALRPVIEQPSEAGIGWASPAYLFRAPSMQTMLLALKVSNLEKWHKLAKQLADGGLLTQPVERDGYYTADLAEAGIRLAYNNGTLLAVYAESIAQQDKWLAALTALMKQSEAQSIHHNQNFAALNRQKGDIRVMLTPDALPFNLRGILSWPHGTQLVGSLLFENGRIYSTLQQADFEGDTHESNQPFHPQSGRELQQAMMQMAHGTPFNIALTTDELLTLTNLRVLMQFAPNDPEIQTLHNLLSRIELVNMRGDYRRTRFTVVLTEKSTNALQQFIEFVKGMI